MTNTTTPIDEADQQLLNAMADYHAGKQAEKDITPAHL